MKNKFTSIFGAIAGLCALLSQSGVHIPVKGIDLVGVVGASALAGVGIAAKDWRVTGGTVRND